MRLDNPIVSQIKKGLSCCIGECKKEKCPYWFGSCDDLHSDALALLESMRPVKRGRWVEETDRVRHWHCSQCGKVYGVQCVFMDYCGNCGAEMAEHPWGTGESWQTIISDQEVHKHE